MIAHPFLYATPEQFDIARGNIARHEWAQRTYREIKLDADKLAEMQLPKFETAWWQEAKKKPWQDTYPEINLHTGSAVRPTMNAAFQSALTYKLGGGDVYADRAKQVLLHYTSYSFEFIHPDVGLNYATWGMQALRTYDMLYDRFTPEEREKMDDFFNRMLEAVVANDEWWIAEGLGGKFNNHYTWHKLMMAAYGLFYEKPKWVERALNSEQGIRELMDHSFLDEGLWFESALNYHYTALHGLIALAWTLRNAGYPLDLFTHEFANGRTLEQGFSAMVQTLFPDMTIPQIGDTYGFVVHLPDEPSYETAWVIYDDPLYGWLISHKKKPFRATSLFRKDDASQPEAPAVESRIFPEHGYAILRSVEGKDYWLSDSWAAFVSYDLDSVHAHRDKMDLILFGKGKTLLQDVNALASAPHAFSAKVTAELNRSTVCHNTLMVDGREQSVIGEKLSLVEFKRLPGMRTVTIGDPKGLIYPGVRMQRTVAVTDAYVLDVFQVSSDEEHDYDWLTHAIDDEGTTRMEGEFSPAALPDSPPWNWLKNARSVEKEGNWTADWRQDDVQFRLTMLGMPGTKVTLCDFPRNDAYDPPQIPMMMVRRTAKSAAFIAVYQAERRDPPPVVISALADRHEMLRVRVEVEGRSFDHLMPRLGGVLQESP